MSIDIYMALAKYHAGTNLIKCIPHAREGRIISPVTGKPINEGEENELYPGVLIVANGPTIVKELIESDFVHEDDIDRFVHARDGDALMEYIDSCKGKDGAYLFDGNSSSVAMVRMFNNRPNGAKADLDRCLPDDFVSYDGTIPKTDVGTKTRLAATVPKAYPHMKALQIKRTGYTDFAIGKVTLFGTEGLEKELFFSYDNGVNAVEREYRMKDGKLVRACERSRMILPSVRDIREMIYAAA